MTWEYSEDNLIEQTAINLFFNELGWDTLLAYNKEGFGEGSTLGRLNKKEVLLKKIFMEKIISVAKIKIFKIGQKGKQDI